MLPDGLTIEEILPHRGGMLLIGEVLEADGEKAITQSTVSESWPLTDARGADALVLIELAAQTAGINNGLKFRLEQGPGSNHMGWIVGIKSARLRLSQIPMGTQVKVTSWNQFSYEGFREIQAEAAIEGNVIALITMQLIQADPDKDIVYAG